MAMCVGGIALNVVFFGALAVLGVTYSEDQLPSFALLAIGANLAIAMAAWMRFRKHELRPTLEMASTSIMLAVGVIAAAAIGLIDEGDRLTAVTTLACPVMLVPMVLRWDLYASSHGMHGRSAAA
jgi:predicted amidohydrolase